MTTNYDGDYRCQASEAEDDHCGRVATQVRREPYTPAQFKVLTCDEHADPTYLLDKEATAQLLRDIEREKCDESYVQGAVSIYLQDREA